VPNNQTNVDVMKATIEFNLPEEDYEFKRAVKALDMACVLWDIMNHVRKNDLDNEKFYDIMSEHNIDLEDLMY
jgi:hypothetical protein